MISIRPRSIVEQTMPSAALKWWRTEGRDTLDNMVSVHRAVGGAGPGRRYATDQVNNAYAVLLSSQFQKFSRDLHTECSDHLARQTPPEIRAVVFAVFTDGRRLDSGNPNPGNIGADFGRFGFKFWDNVRALNAHGEERRRKLDQLNVWRNAISHHDYSDLAFAGRTAVSLDEVRRWRGACDGLARDFDSVLKSRLVKLTALPPW